MSEVASPWESRFNLANCADLRERLKIVPAPPALDQFDLEDAATRLNNALVEVYVPFAQDLAAIRRVFGTARAHAAKHFGGAREYLSTLYEHDDEGTAEPLTTMITSLAGIGKTMLARACDRLLSPPLTVDVPDHGSVPLVGGITISIGSGSRRVDILNAIARKLAGEENEDREFLNGNALSKQRVRKMLRRAGVCFILVDEFQFLTSSAGASAQLSKTLAFLREFDVPLFFVGNFSLGWRLLKRPQEERQRFLSSPVIMMPDLANDPAYSELLAAYKHVCGGVLDIDPIREAKDIHWFTFGNKRLLRQLIVEAYRIARRRALQQKGETLITLRDLRHAYSSSALSMNQQDVEALRQHLAGGKIAAKDLVCPFPLPQDLASIHKKAVDQMLEYELAHARLAAEMTATESKGLERARDQLGLDTPVPTKPKLPRSSRLPKTAEELRKGFDALFPGKAMPSHRRDVG